MTTQPTTLPPTTKQPVRVRLGLVGAGAAVVLAMTAGVLLGTSTRHGHGSIQAGAAWPVTAIGGSISRTDALGGEAEFLRDHPPVQPAGGQASSLPATTSSGTTAASTASLYLVGSAPQASQLQHGIDEADVIRHTLGLAPLAATVRPVGPEASADEVTWLRTTLTTARGAQGLAPLTVVDLRTPDAAASGAPVSDQEMSTQWLESHTPTAAPPQSPPDCPLVGPYSGIC
jgi:hypothetical protein